MNKNNWLTILIFLVTITSTLVFSAFTTFETKIVAKDKYAQLIRYLCKLEDRQEKIYDILIEMRDK